MSRLTGFVCLMLAILSTYGQDFKVIGYLPYYRFGYNDQIEYQKLTHLNLAFLNPDTQGNLSIGGQNIDPIVTKARMVNPDIQIYISLAGGGMTPEWQAAYDYFLQSANRSGFIHSLIGYMNDHNLDGIDVDLEWGMVNSLYSPFVIELADSVVAHGLGITAAWPATYRYPDITNDALAVFDFINLMAYDLTGPWAPSNPGPHSPYSFAQSGINYWFNQGVSYDKMTLGVPFYGYNFTDQNNVSSFTYRSMVEEDTAYAYLDQVGQKYYNGIPTIQAKTTLALSQVGGIMIWELGQDAFGAYQSFSLLRAIDDQIAQSATDIEQEITHPVRIYPNPFSGSFTVAIPSQLEAEQLTLVNLSGQICLRQKISPADQEITVDTGQIPAGMYIARVEGRERIASYRLIKLP